MSTIKSIYGVGCNSLYLSEFKVSRYEYMAPLGRMVRTCNDVVLGQDSLTNLGEMRVAALNDVAEALQLSQNWLARWRSVLRPPKTRGDDVFLGQGDSRAARENTSLSAFVFGLAYMRIYIALGGREALEMERRGVVTATDLLKSSIPQDDAMAVFDVMFTRIAARTFLDTTHEWQRYLRRTEGTGKVIEADTWFRFLHSWGASPAS